MVKSMRYANNDALFGPISRVIRRREPELPTFLRSVRIYQKNGRPSPWIGKRLDSISTRQELTREWRRRGIADSEQYRNLTNELMHQTFGMDVNAYRSAKGLSRTSQSLRDHMTDLELVLTNLAEVAAATLHRRRQSQGFDELLEDVRNAGQIASLTRRRIESAAETEPAPLFPRRASY